MSDETTDTGTPEQNGQPEQTQDSGLTPERALEILAQTYNTTPEYIDGSVRLQDENRRQIDALRRKERDLEAREARLQAMAELRQNSQQSYDGYDPSVRTILERLDLMDRREQERDKREMEKLQAQERQNELALAFDNGFESIMRGVPEQKQVSRDRFFQTMMRIYPPQADGTLPRGVTPDLALETTARYLGYQPNGGFGGYSNPPPNPSRDRRASMFIPGSAPSVSSQPTPDDAGPQRPGESIEEYVMRRRAYREKNPIPREALQEGVRYSSE